MRGVSFREAELFKSYVRVLNFNLQYQWLYSEAAPHLIIYGENTERSQSKNEDAVPHSLTLSKSNFGDMQCLSLPLNSVEIANVLNRIGLSLGGKVNASKIPQLLIFDLTLQYRLKRWPPPKLINTHARIRLATLMTRQAISVEVLNKKSGLDIETCKSFVFDLYTAGLLAKETKRMENSQQSTLPLYVQPGVLSRIRNKLSRLIGSE